MALSEALIMNQVSTDYSLKVQIQWEDMWNDKDTLEPVKKSYEVVHESCVGPLQRCTTPVDLNKQTQAELGL